MSWQLRGFLLFIFFAFEHEGLPTAAEEADESRADCTHHLVQIPDQAHSSIQEVLTYASRRFAFDLFQALAKSQPQENFVVSPVSVFVALIKDAIQTRSTSALQKLYLESQSFEALESVLDSWLSRLKSGDSSIHFQSGSLIRTDNEAKDTSNWVAFTGPWIFNFNPLDTIQREFQNQDGSKSQVLLMNHSQRTFRFLYHETEGQVQAIRIGLGSFEPRMLLDIFLPEAGTSTDTFIEKHLTASAYFQTLDAMNPWPIDLYLPRIAEPTLETDLTQALHSLGFNLGGRQRVFMEWLEQGEEIDFDALNKITGFKVEKSKPAVVFQRMMIDRPFAFFLQETFNHSQTPLLMGIIRNRSQP